MVEMKIRRKQNTFNATICTNTVLSEIWSYYIVMISY